MLTPEEQALAANAAILLTKNKIIQTVYELFGQLAEAYKLYSMALPPELIHVHAKIAKGENYLGLPWVMLDYPRNFTGPDRFAIRTMFWWGNYFSLHLLLQGKKMALLHPEKLLRVKGWYFTVDIDPWRHHFDESVALPIEAVTAELLKKQAANGFYKISIYLPLTEWNSAAAFFKEKFVEAIGWLQP